VYVVVTIICFVFDGKIKRCQNGIEFPGEEVLRGRVLRNDQDFARDPFVHFRCENLKIYLLGMYIIQFQLQGFVNTARVRHEAMYGICVGSTAPFRVEKLHALLDCDEESKPWGGDEERRKTPDSSRFVKIGTGAAPCWYQKFGNLSIEVDPRGDSSHQEYIEGTSELEHGGITMLELPPLRLSRAALKTVHPKRTLPWGPPLT